MSTAAPGDRSRVTVGVAVPPAQAFRIFTEQIGRPARGLARALRANLTPFLATLASPQGGGRLGAARRRPTAV